MKILIIEDEPSLREIMQRALVQERYVVETASTYSEADAKIAAYSYDCILLDIMLPDGNGLQLLKHLKELRKRSMPFLHRFFLAVAHFLYGLRVRLYEMV